MDLARLDREQIRRRGFSEFVKRAWHLVEAVPLIWEPHMDLLCAHYEAVSRNEIKDLVVNVPPGTSKSLLSSILYPAWDWIENPWRKFIFVTYDKQLSLDFAKRSLLLMQSSWFTERWPEWSIVGGEKVSSTLIKNSAGGVRFSTMMGGAAIGRHAHVLVVDDPHKPDNIKGKAESAQAALDQAWTRWTETFSRRVADASSFSRICIMQRLHEEDLAGRMLRDPATVHVCLPMRFEKSRACVTKWGRDWRTEPGELLCPKRFPADYIDGLEHSATGLPARAFASQFQQRPAPEQGALFMRSWFQSRWSECPEKARWLISVDASLKDHRDADYAVIQVWAWKGAEFFLIDQCRSRMAFSATVEAIQELRKNWSLVSQVLIEDKANGPAIVDALRRSMTGVLAINPQGGKFSRAQAVEPLLRAGNVQFPSDKAAPWMGDLIEEFATFPVGSHDDCVDAASQALMFMSGKTRNLQFRKAMDRARKLTTSPRLR